MKCTPQKTMYSASGPGGRLAGQLERVAGHVGELDDLVALVVVAEHEHPVAERRLRGAARAPPGRGRRRPAGRPGTRRRARSRGSLPRPSSSSAVAVSEGSTQVEVTCPMVPQRGRRAAASQRCDAATLLGMRVLLCPDKFAGTLSAVEAADAIAAGWRRGRRPATTCSSGPLSDGGPGFVDVLPTALGGRRVAGADRRPAGPPGRRRDPAHDGGDRLRWRAPRPAGCTCSPRPSATRRPPPRTGWALLVAAAVEAGARDGRGRARRLGTNDGGAGCSPRSARPRWTTPARPCRTAGPRWPRVRRARRRAPAARRHAWSPPPTWTTRCSGCTGASSVFGPQKGADRADVLLLDAALERFAAVLERDLPGCPTGLAALPGAGAAGGLGAALLALGGRCESGHRPGHAG